MRTNKTNYFILVLVILYSLVLSCRPAQKAESKQLTLAVVSGVEGDALKQAAIDYEKQTGVHINIAQFPYASLFEKELIDLNAHTGAYDLIMLDDPWFPRFTTKQFLTDLTPLLQKRGQSGPDPDFVSTSLALCKHPYQTGALYALPYVGNSQLFFYRKDLFDKYSLKEPQKWDEPLSNLDARLRVQMRGELKRLQHQLGTTTVYVTHDQAEAMTLAHRVAVMRKGKLQQFDSPMNIYERPANRFVAEFVGSPSMNFIDGEISNRKFVGADFSIQLGTTDNSQLSGRRLSLGIRPEHIRIARSSEVGALPAKVYVTELMGNETFVFLTVGANKLIARAPAEFRAEDEETVWLSFMTEKVHFFDRESEVRLE